MTDSLPHPRLRQDRLFVIAGDYSQFRYLCMDSGLHPRQDAVYVRGDRDLLGVMNPHWCVYGTYHLRRGWSDLVQRLLAFGGVEVPAPGPLRYGDWAWRYCHLRGNDDYCRCYLDAHILSFVTTTDAEGRHIEERFVGGLVNAAYAEVTDAGNLDRLCSPFVIHKARTTAPYSHVWAVSATLKDSE